MQDLNKTSQATIDAESQRRIPSGALVGISVTASLLLAGCGHSGTVAPSMKLGHAQPPAPAANNFPESPEICDDHFDYGICLLTRKVEGVNLQRSFFETLTAVRVVTPVNKDEMPFLKEKTIADALTAREDTYIDMAAGHSKDAAQVADGLALPKPLRELMGIHFKRVSAPNANGCFTAEASSFSFYTDATHEANMTLCRDKAAKGGWRVAVSRKR